ncbi:hypothetical protein [Pseudomonas sp. 31 R 17]|nr:hypothetical protein [Pseudomonas sp. 31 R 17]
MWSYTELNIDFAAPQVSSKDAMDLRWSAGGVTTDRCLRYFEMMKRFDSR